MEWLRCGWLATLTTLTTPTRWRRHGGCALLPGARVQVRSDIGWGMQLLQAGLAVRCVYINMCSASIVHYSVQACT